MSAHVRITLRCDGCGAELVTGWSKATEARRSAQTIGWRFGSRRVTASGPALSVDLCEVCAPSPPSDVRLVNL